MDATLVALANARSILLEAFGSVLEPLFELLEAAESFRKTGPTPEATFAFEKQVEEHTREIGRVVLEEACNAQEPEPEACPQGYWFGGDYYRSLNKKTPRIVATLFGKITLWRCLYRHSLRTEPALFPLELNLGLEVSVATSAFAERVGQLVVDHEESMVLTWICQRHGVDWGKKTLRKVVASLADGLASFRAETQKKKLLAALTTAHQTHGPWQVTLSVGRDGVMVPIRKEKFKEASTATLAVYDRCGKRVDTVYLGCMPEEFQQTLSDQLTDLIKTVLGSWSEQDPRLIYVTDAGHHPRHYYETVLRNMRHPAHPERKLKWQWVVDFWHACQYVMKLANGLFGANTAKARIWYQRMRRWLRDRRHGLAHILRSAGQLQGRRRMGAATSKDYWEAYRFLRKHSRHMCYWSYKAEGLPIGSGVTEAACKIVFSERMRRSGMTWNRASGQRIVTLRILHLSGCWEDAWQSHLKSKSEESKKLKKPSCKVSRPKPASKAA